MAVSYLIDDKQFERTIKYSLRELIEIFREERHSILFAVKKTMDASRAAQELLHHLENLMNDELNQITSLDDFECVIEYCCRMSFQDWFNSLP